MMHPSPFTRVALVATAMIAVGVAMTTGAPPRSDGPAQEPTTAREYIVHWPTGTAAALADVDGVTVLDTPGADELEKLGAYVVKVDGAGTIDAILAAGAEYVEPNATFSSHGGGGPMSSGGGAGAQAGDPLLPQQWFHKTIGSVRAWGTAQGQGVLVAVVDSGVGPHPDLTVTGGRDFTGGDGRWTDQYGHGTHVAGLCCAIGGNDIGGSGVAPRASVLSARVLEANGQGSLDAVAAGIVWSADQGAQVINLSLGGPSGTRSLNEALAYAYGHGSLIVCAAGNDGSTRPMYPAARDDCLSVGASTSGDSAASFSNRHASVDISAPGESILSTCLGGGYCLMDGTSMAAPLVSGAAALVIASGVSGPGAVSWRLRSTAAPRQAVVSGKRLDVAAALAARPTGVPAPATLAPRPTAPVATPYPTMPPTPTLGVRIIPIVVPPGCHVAVMCQEPYPGP